VFRNVTYWLTVVSYSPIPYVYLTLPTVRQRFGDAGAALQLL
jgi:hypothetical protein